MSALFGGRGGRSSSHRALYINVLVLTMNSKTNKRWFGAGFFRTQPTTTLCWSDDFTDAKTVRPAAHPQIFWLLSHLLSMTPPGQFLFGGFSLSQYQAKLSWLNEALGFEGCSSHSPRAGFATDHYLAGQDFVALREEGRWLSDTSLRIYLDVVSTALQATAPDAAVWASDLDYLAEHFYDCFPWWPESPVQPSLALPARVLAAAAYQRRRRS